MKPTFLQEMNHTLEQLSKNEEVLKSIQENPEFRYEKEILERTQASLAAHLFHLENRSTYRLRKARTRKKQVIVV